MQPAAQVSLDQHLSSMTNMQKCQLDCLAISLCDPIDAAALADISQGGRGCAMPPAAETPVQLPLRAHEVASSSQAPCFRTK